MADDEAITAIELGVAALPVDATPAERARAEALWRPAPAGEPCRCSGPCHHGETCAECDGRVEHRDRFPSSLFTGGQPGLTTYPDTRHATFSHWQQETEDFDEYE